MNQLKVATDPAGLNKALFEVTHGLYVLTAVTGGKMNVDKFAAFPHETGENGCLLLPDAKAFWECTVIPELTADLGTHTLFVAAVDRAGTRAEGEPSPITSTEKRCGKGGSDG